MNASIYKRPAFASAGRRIKSLKPAFLKRTRELVAGFSIAASVLIIPASPLSATPIFATYSGSNAGSLDGVAFSMTGLSAPGFGSDIQNLTMSESDWNSVGTQQGRIFNANTANAFNVTFDTPVSGLQMYLYYFRGGGIGGGGYDSYGFNGGLGNTFTITGGLGSPITQTGITLDTSSANFANGVLSFTDPVSSLAVTTTGGPATGGDQGFTFAVVPEPGALGLVALGCAGTAAGFAACRSRRRRGGF